MQEHPEIVSKTRKFDETDFQKEMVQFVSQKLVKSPETDFYEENKDRVKSNKPNIGVHKSIYISSDVENESLYALRAALRENIFRHDKFRPELDTVTARKLFHGMFHVDSKKD